MSFRLPLGLTRSIHRQLGCSSTPITSVFRRQISSKPLALRQLLPPSPVPSAAPALAQSARDGSHPRSILSSLRRSFASTARRSVRSTYFPNRGGSPWGNSRPPSGGWFSQLRRRIDNQNPMHIIYWLIGLNVGVYLLWQYAISSFRRFRDPALYQFMVNNFIMSENNFFSGRIWTLITACFSHSSGSHILINCLGLYFIAPAALSVLGGSGFLGLYLGGGIASSFISLLWHRSTAAKHVGSEGASGAIYSTLGFYALLFPNAKVLMFFIIPMPVWVAIAGMFGYDLYTAMLNPHSRTDSAGHIGGMAFGLLAALRYKRGFRMFRR